MNHHSLYYTFTQRYFYSLENKTQSLHRHSNGYICCDLDYMWWELKLTSCRVDQFQWRICSLFWRLGENVKVNMKIFRGWLESEIKYCDYWNPVLRWRGISGLRSCWRDYPLKKSEFINPKFRQALRLHRCDKPSQKI